MSAFVCERSRRREIFLGAPFVDFFDPNCCDYGTHTIGTLFWFQLMARREFDDGRLRVLYNSDRAVDPHSKTRHGLYLRGSCPRSYEHHP